MPVDTFQLNTTRNIPVVTQNCVYWLLQWGFMENLQKTVLGEACYKTRTYVK